MTTLALQVLSIGLNMLMLSSQSAPPAHLVWAQRLLVDLQRQDNSYGSHPTVVQWQGVDGARRSLNRSVCSSFITALIQRAYGYRFDEMRHWLGTTRPLAIDYYNAIANGKRFQAVHVISEVDPGDLLATRRLRPGAGSTGHLMLAAGRPERVEPCNRPMCRYRLQVIDSSRRGHGPSDSRGNASGAGIGAIELNVDGAGRVNAYRWSERTGSRWRSSEDEPMLIGRFCGKACG